MLKDSDLDSLNERNFRLSIPDELPEQRCGPSCRGLDSALDTVPRTVLRNSVLGSEAVF